MGKGSRQNPASKLGAYHGVEQAYVFRVLNIFTRPYADWDYKLSDSASSYWVNFAKTGDPNGTGLTTWPAFDDKNQQMLYLGDKIEVGPIPNKAGIDFFDAYYDATRPALK